MKSETVAFPKHGEEIQSRKQAAKLLGVSVRFLEKVQAQGTGPAFVRLSPRKIGYWPSDLYAWAEQRTVRKEA